MPPLLCAAIACMRHLPHSASAQSLDFSLQGNHKHWRRAAPVVRGSMSSSVACLVLAVKDHGLLLKCDISIQVRCGGPQNGYIYLLWGFVPEILLAPWTQQSRLAYKHHSTCQIDICKSFLHAC